MRNVLVYKGLRWSAIDTAENVSLVAALPRGIVAAKSS